MTWDKSKGRPEPIAALNRVLEQENGEPLVALAECAPTAVIHRTTVIPFLRETVAHMLEQAAKALPPGYQLGVVDAWRPMHRQTRIYEWLSQCLDTARPGLDRATRRRLINRFVAPVDQKAPPGHTTGAAVDVHLLDAQGVALDTTSPLERLRGAPTYAYGLSEQALRNRMLLVETMLGAGFSNCRDEWWHYSYGDAGWAVRVGQTTCQYGKVELDGSIYAENEAEWVRGLDSRPNPFLQEGAPGQGPKAAKRSAG